MQVETTDGVMIIGGGIGGLCAALALQQAGIPVRVYERAPAITEIGAGLPLWANATRVLDSLGIGAALRAVSVPGMTAEFRSARGTLLAELPSHKLVEKYGAAHIGVHRADLQAILLAALHPGVVTLGARCVGFRQDGSGVTARFADGRQARGSILVGADGMRSVVRTQLVDRRPPRYAGYTAWRGVAPLQTDLFPLGVGMETWGRGRRFGASHIGGGRVYWFATKTAPEGERDRPGGRKAELRACFRGWHPLIGLIIEATEDGAILRNDIYEHRALRRWGAGRVTLLGDAAHTMTPNLGQGACQAIEDAAVLAHCIRLIPDPGAALRRYEARRNPRTTLIAKQSQLTGRFAQVQHSVACRVRDTLTKLTPAAVILKQIEWIVGYDATRSA